MVHTIELVRRHYESLRHAEPPVAQPSHNLIHIAFPTCRHNTELVLRLVSFYPLISPSLLVHLTSGLYYALLVAFVPLLIYYLSLEYTRWCIKRMVKPTTSAFYSLCDIVRCVPLTLTHPALQRNTKISFESGLPAQQHCHHSGGVVSTLLPNDGTTSPHYNPCTHARAHSDQTMQASTSQPTNNPGAGCPTDLQARD